MLKFNGVEYKPEQYKDLAESLEKEYKTGDQWIDQIEFEAYVDRLKLLEQWLMATGAPTDGRCFCGGCYRCKKSELRAELIEAERTGEKIGEVRQKLRELKTRRLSKGDLDA